MSLLVHLAEILVRFLKYIDDCAFRRYGFVSKSAEEVCFVGNHSRVRGCDGKKPQAFGVAEDRTIEKLRSRMGKVFVTCGEELDSMTDESEQVPMKREFVSYKLVKGNIVVKAPPIRKTMVFDKGSNVRQFYGNAHDVTSSEENDSVGSAEETLGMSSDNERKHGSKTRNMILALMSRGNLYKVYGDKPESTISEEDDSTSGSRDGNEVEGIKNVLNEEETRCENEVSSSEGSEGDAIVTRNGKEHEREIHLRKGSLMFSPPLPLEMEP